MISRALVRYLLAVALICIGTRMSAQVSAYYLSPIGPIGPTNDQLDLGINQAGEVVGTNSSGQAFVFSLSAGTKIIGASGTSARAINDSGQIAMQVANHAQIFTRSTGQLTDLGTLGGLSSSPRAINSSGVVVGQSQDSTGQYFPFMFNGGPMFSLGSFGGSLPSCAANGVNISNEAVGVCLTPVGYFRAFYVLKGFKDFDPSHISYSSQATAINDSGVAVGGSKAVRCSRYSLNLCEGLAWHAAIFFPNGTIQVLGTLNPSYAYADALAYGINNPGDIVGDSEAPGGFHGFIYTNGKLYDLNNWSFRDTSNNPLTGWVITSANGINDYGQIVGKASDPSGTLQIVLLTPVKFIVP
jgi:probable HAF family extracellular repeat protein